MFPTNSPLHSIHFRIRFVDRHVRHHLLDSESTHKSPSETSLHFIFAQALELKRLHNVHQLYALAALLLVALEQVEDLAITSRTRTDLRLRF